MYKLHMPRTCTRVYVLGVYWCHLPRTCAGPLPFYSCQWVLVGHHRL